MFVCVCVCEFERERERERECAQDLTSGLHAYQVHIYPDKEVLI